MSPLARSLALLRQLGYMADVVERPVPELDIKRDLFGFGDIFAFHQHDKQFLIVQATTVDHIAARLKKARALATLAGWLAAGGRFEVHGWVLRDGRWRVKRVEVLADQVEPVIIEKPPRKRRQSRYRPGDLFSGLE